MLSSSIGSGKMIVEFFSDAISLAVHYDPPLPIYVNEDVLGEVT